MSVGVDREIVEAKLSETATCQWLHEVSVITAEMVSLGQEGDVTWHHGWIQHGAPPVARGQDSSKLGIA